MLLPQPRLRPLSTRAADKRLGLAQTLSFLGGLWQQLSFDCSTSVNLLLWVQFKKYWFVNHLVERYFSRGYEEVITADP